MKYSIIIPMYNVQHYISKCLKSIFEQNFKDYELILVDDGSNDNTLEEARKFVGLSGMESITRILTKNNSGASDTRNVGIKSARAEYIIFMDADDQMTENSLSTMDRSVSEKDADLYVFSLIKNADGVVTKSNLSLIDNFFINQTNSVLCLERYLEKTNYIITWQPWSKIFKRSIIEQNEIEFDPSLYCCNDFNFFMKYMLKTNSVLFNNAPTTIYSVDRPGSISTTKLERRFDSSIKAYSEMFCRIKSMGVECPHLLSYMSYLFLCSFDIVSKMSNEQISKLDDIIEKNKEIYYYATDKISSLRRLCFKLFGFKLGSKIIDIIRICTIKLRRKNSEI